MKALLDTSVALGTPPREYDLSLSVVTVAEIRFGIERAPDPVEGRRRSARLAALLDLFDPLPVDRPVADAWGVLAGQSVRLGRKPRATAFDLLIAATAQVHGRTLLTYDADLLRLSDVLDVRRP